MIALPLRRPTPAPSTPGRLVAGAIVASAGVVAFSVAVGSFVVGSGHRPDAATAVDAAALVAAVPSLVLVGLLHLFVATVLVIGTGAVRNLATAVIGLAAIVALGRAAVLLIGVDLTDGLRIRPSTTDGVAVLAIAAAAYGTAAIVSGPIGSWSAMIRAGGIRWPSFPPMRPI